MEFSVSLLSLAKKQLNLVSELERGGSAMVGPIASVSFLSALRISAIMAAIWLVPTALTAKSPPESADEHQVTDQEFRAESANTRADDSVLRVSPGDRTDGPSRHDLAHFAQVDKESQHQTTYTDTQAHGSASAHAKLEEVLVTAHRRLEDLQDVPVSAQVISTETLTEQNHYALEELTQTLPAVHVATGGASNDLFIRGIGSAEDPSFDQSVAMFTDDIYKGRSRMSDATFLDLDRIEVLKGPQTTFFGNNAIAGALNIVTKKPGKRLDMWSRALYGMFGQYAIEGAVGGPITDTLGVRVAATRNGDDRGWIDNVNTNRHVPRLNNLAGRVTFAFDPSEALNATLKVEASQHRISGTSLDQPRQYTNCPPPAPLPPSFGGLGGCAQALTLGVPIGISSNEISALPGQGNRLSTFESVLTFTYQKWSQTFTSVSGFYKYNFDTNEDFAQLPVPLVTGQEEESYHQFSQEFRVASPSDQQIEYLAGLYFQTDRLTPNAELNAPLFNFLATIPGLSALSPYLPISGNGFFKQGEDVYSLFGALSWNINPRLKLSSGLRGSSVRKDVDAFGVFGSSTQLYGGWVPFPQAIWPIVDTVFGPSCCDPAAAPSPTLRKTDKAWMPYAAVQYRLNPRTMAYFTYTRGFKAGGFEGQQLDSASKNGTLDLIPYKPEYVNAYEFGVKSRALSDKLLLSVDVFRSDYTDLQSFAVIFIPQFNTFGGVVVNAAKSRSQGVEMQAQWLIFNDFQLSTDVTYLDSYYVSFPNAPASTLQQFCAGADAGTTGCSGFQTPVPAFRDISGQQTPFAPRWSGSLTARYRPVVAGAYRLVAELSPYFTSSYWGSAGPDDVIPRVHSYLRLDARIGVESPDERWNVDMIGKNLTDRVITSGSSDLYLSSRLQPRNVAVQVRYRW